MPQVALRATLAGRRPAPGDASAVLDELLDERSTLTRRLLGQGADGEAVPAPFPAMVHTFGAAGLPSPGLDIE